MRISFPGQEMSWVRVVLGTSCPGYDCASSHQALSTPKILRLTIGQLVGQNQVPPIKIRVASF